MFFLIYFWTKKIDMKNKETKNLIRLFSKNYIQVCNPLLKVKNKKQQELSNTYIRLVMRRKQTKKLMRL